MKGTIASVGIGIATVFGAVEASVFNETPLERVETIKNERVEVRQIENVVQTIMSWKGESGLTIKVDMGAPTLTERMADKRKVEVRFEVKNETEFEYGLLLNEIPATSTFCYTVETEQYDWFKQPPLTQEEIDAGAFRPENVINSFAVYHKTLKNHRLGETNYETGKAFHRYRAEAVDANGNRTWAMDSTMEGDKLCDHFDSKWLSEAIYPVKL